MADSAWAACYDVNDYESEVFGTGSTEYNARVFGFYPSELNTE